MDWIDLLFPTNPASWYVKDGLDWFIIPNWLWYKPWLPTDPGNQAMVTDAECYQLTHIYGYHGPWLQTDP